VLGVTEIGRQLGLRKGTVHRLLAILAQQGMIARDAATQRYRLGYKVFHLGAQFARQYHVRDVALPVMRRLWQQTGETATLTLRIGDQRMYLEQIESAEEMRVTVDIGKPLPLYCGSAGKVFLAWMAEDELDRVLGPGPLPPLTPNTIVDRKQLEADLARIRARGFSMSKGERVAGVNGVNAPIRDSTGLVVAAVGVSGPALRFDVERVLDVAPLVTLAATGISELLGHAVEAAPALAAPGRESRG
jgi:DNA-binding IclR family transcriptional regulator